MMKRLESAAVMITAGAFIMFALSSLVDWGVSAEWHDQQRLGQTIFISLCGLTAFVFCCGDVRSPFISKQVKILGGVIVALGLLSVALSRQSMWALVEFALQLGCLGLAWWVAVVRIAVGGRFDRFLIATIFMVCGLHVWQFTVAYVAFTVTGLGAGDPWLLLSGFSYPRFYGQFITLTLPLLAWPLMRSDLTKSQLGFVLALLSCWWAIAFISGTRGTWLGLLCAMLAMLFVGGLAKRWVISLCVGALIGVLLCWLAVSVIPSLLEVEVNNHPSDRLSTSLTGRAGIWGRAVDMIWMRPWLGFGPMHFADQFKGIHENIPAHPHQALLQWASEWGLPSLLLVSWLICRGCFHVFRVLAKHGDAPAGGVGEKGLMVCVFGAVLASLVQSMVDGVFVMPVTETWLVIMAGWLWGIYSCSQNFSASGVNHATNVAWRWAWLMAGCVLMFVVVRDLPRLNDRVEEFAEAFGGPLLPRFWTQGIISHEK